MESKWVYPKHLGDCLAQVLHCVSHYDYYWSSFSLIVRKHWPLKKCIMEHKDHLYLSATLILRNTVKHNEVEERTSVEAKIDAKSYALLLKKSSVIWILCIPLLWFLTVGLFNVNVNRRTGSTIQDTGEESQQQSRDVAEIIERIKHSQTKLKPLDTAIIHHA